MNDTGRNDEQDAGSPSTDVDPDSVATADENVHEDFRTSGTDEDSDGSGNEGPTDGRRTGRLSFMSNPLIAIPVRIVVGFLTFCLVLLIVGFVMGVAHIRPPHLESQVVTNQWSRITGEKEKALVSEIEKKTPSASPTVAPSANPTVTPAAAAGPSPRSSH